ncbi:polyhydroxybutyrate depolymerase [Geothrix limicola]|uniref:Polyhydroxybutyrate depolymerase n=2 Tax=Geothrix limicola TaxID=2927978 RepID=A0ABQ5QCZ5_9BACT|nr:polyhydroxybutyrate depolymerase [Geothrix limicola]
MLLRMILRNILPSALLVGCLGIPAQAASITEGIVATKDGPRHFLVAVPAGPAQPRRPLVIVLHGHMGNAKNTLGTGLQERCPLSAWAAIADREGLVVAALDGAKGEDGKQGWNDGRPGSTGNPTTDDVAFAKAVIDRMERDQNTDPQRVYAMGMSNGGVFTFRLALELDHPLAAIAATCASMPGDHAPAPASRPMSVLMIEGTKDPLMPYEGGQVHFYKKLRGAVLGTEASLAYWRKVDGLGGVPTQQTIPPAGRSGDPTRVTRMTWGDPGGPQVVLLKVEGGGHCEPSLAHRYGLLYTAVCGKQNGDVESAEEAWRFFRDKRAR